MVTVKEAVSSASAFIADLFPDAREQRLEQVEVAGPSWQVVLSFKLSEPTSPLTLLVPPTRLFKEVDVDRESGEALALRMWRV